LPHSPGLRAGSYRTLAEAKTSARRAAEAAGEGGPMEIYHQRGSEQGGLWHFDASVETIGNVAVHYESDVTEDTPISGWLFFGWAAS